MCTSHTQQVSVRRTAGAQSCAGQWPLYWTVCSTPGGRRNTQPTCATNVLRRFWVLYFNFQSSFSSGIDIALLVGWDQQHLGRRELVRNAEAQAPALTCWATVRLSASPHVIQTHSEARQCSLPLLVAFDLRFSLGLPSPGSLVQLLNH